MVGWPFPVRGSFKATFTFDETTIRHLAEASARLARSKSEIVRDAINEYHLRLDRLGDTERNSKLQALDKLVAEIPLRAGARSQS